jgi:hypothetical protein
VKPGDHPDFFRLPPPPGRSRESRIVLDAQGRFSNGGFPIDHAGMSQAFASWIRRHPDDGRYILTNGYDWTYFRVEDVPYFVKHLEPTERGPVLRLSDDTEELLEPSGLSLSADGVVYAAVKGGEFEARFLPWAQAALVDYLDEEPDGSPVVSVSGARFPVVTRPASRA